jgi:hypothetical protein
VDALLELVEDSAQVASLRNGNSVACVPGSEVSARGYSATHLILVDEAARVEDEVIAAVRPMLAVSANGRISWLSTTRGQHGRFYAPCEGDQRGDWEVRTVPATPRISPAFLEVVRRPIGADALQPSAKNTSAPSRPPTSRCSSAASSTRC